MTAARAERLASRASTAKWSDPEPAAARWARCCHSAELDPGQAAGRGKLAGGG